MECAASTEPGADLDSRYVLSSQAALRNEPFGALAYHYGNRKLTFLRSNILVGIVEDIHNHASLRCALDSAGVPPDKWPSLCRAIGSLVDSELIERLEPPETSN